MIGSIFFYCHVNAVLEIRSVFFLMAYIRDGQPVARKLHAALSLLSCCSLTHIEACAF